MGGESVQLLFLVKSWMGFLEYEAWEIEEDGPSKGGGVGGDGGEEV